MLTKAIETSIVKMNPVTLEKIRLTLTSDVAVMKVKM